MKQRSEAEVAATAKRRSAAAKRSAKKRAAAKKAPLSKADLDTLRAAVRELSAHIDRIDRRVGQMHLHVATLIGHCVIYPQSVLALVQEMLIRLPPHELAKLGIFAPDQRPRPNGATPDV